MKQHLLKRLFLLGLITLGIQVAKAQPVSNFTSNKVTGCAPFSLVINFQDQSTNGATSWKWLFGDVDNSTSIVQNPTFVYSDSGCYTVTLITCNAGGCDTLVRPCYIQIFPQPTVGFTASQLEGCVPFQFSFTDTSSTSSGTLTNWSWTLSNGASGAGPNPNFTIADTGSFGVFLQVTNSHGCTNILQVQNYIRTFQAPTLGFTVDQNSSCNPPLTVQFTNTTVLNGATNPSYVWQFPGGLNAAGIDSSTQTTPLPVTYNAAGTYGVSLIFSSGNGCADTLTRPNLIGIGGVTANFLANDTVVCIGQPVLFTNTSTGGVSSLEWNFGETPGVNGTTQTITHLYNTPGNYTVTLRANNAQCGDTLVKTSYIQVLPVPTAAFTANKFIDCMPGNPFTFTDQSTGAASWQWSFGDGATSILRNPTHSFATYDTFQVCLISTNGQGCSDTVCQNVIITPPTADFTGGPRIGCIPLSVNLTSISVSSDPITQYNWTFSGAGVAPTTATGNATSVTLNTQGNLDVTLIIVTQTGCRDTVVKNSYVEVGTPPTVDFTFSEDTVCINQSLVFESLFKNSNWDYYWDFQYEAPSGNFVQLTDSLPYAYSDTGSFSVGLMIDNNGCRDSLIKNDIIYVGPPKAQFTISDSLLCRLADSVIITNTTIGPADIYTWLVNNVQYSTLQNPPALQITTPGTYLITLAVENSATGCTDTANAVVFARNPVADFTSDFTFGCRPLTIKFTQLSVVPFLVSSSWRIQTSTMPPVNSGQANPLLTFPDTGNYTVRLQVLDNLGCRDTMIKPAYFRVVGPTANFISNLQGGCPGQQIRFSDQSTTTFDANVVSWLWNFGDPASGTANTSALQNPFHVYSAPGAYTVTLTATDDNGCSHTFTRPNYIVITFPSPNFVVADTSTCAGIPVPFTSTSTGSGLSFSWNFGNGQTGTGSAPTNIYSTTGYHDVTLVVTDINGCVDSITKPNYIFIEEFRANFGGDPLIGICPPLNSQFTDSTVGAVVSWRWNFGTGFNFSNLQNPANVYLAPGKYDVTLIATHEDGCKDTLVRPEYVNLAGPNGRFVLDPPNACLGDTICITAYTTGAALATFDFRDGNAFTVVPATGLVDTTVQCHVYATPGIFNPVVVLQDPQGCVFTLTSPNPTRIYNIPVAAFLPIDSIGCLPFAVPFSDVSTLGDTAIANWKWLFGDGDSSSTQNPSHLYLGAGAYDVTMQVTDFHGCKDTVTVSAIEVFQGATANFTASDSLNCAPFDIQFTDLSYNYPAANWIWDFGDGNSVSGIQNPTHTYANDGVYTVTLVVQDTLGCSDTLIKQNYINLRHPDARLYASSAIGCNPVTLTFFADSSISDTTILSYQWCIRNLLTGAITCSNTGIGIDTLDYLFNVPGSFSVTVQLVDALGCVGTSDSVVIVINERFVPEPLTMRYVTVKNDQTVEVAWEPYPLADFVDYAVYRMNGPSPGIVALITNQNTTTFQEVNPLLDCSKNVYCYKVLAKNLCDEYSSLDLTEQHCTVELKTVSGLDQITLNWNGYVGFPVVVYEVYRVVDYSTPLINPIGAVGGNQFTFTDTAMFCRDSVAYRVQAIGIDPENRSQSDISKNAPQHNLPSEPTQMIAASVVNNLDIEVSWESYPGYKPAYYYLEKSQNGTSWDSVAQFPLTTFTYLDTTVDVNSRSYFYRVFAVDSCGERSVVGRYGKTMLIESAFLPRAEIPVLNWSAYLQWRSGVLNYQIEVLNDLTGQWDLVDIIPGNLTTYQDNKTKLNQPVYCYRVRAEEVAGNNATSLSNETCLIFSPDLYAPNAFTPNGDGKNEQFRVFAPNIANGELRIFDRWGTEIYYSTNLDMGWDGTFKGSDVQEGVYVFVVNAVGLNGDMITRSGTITLLR